MPTSQTGGTPVYEDEVQRMPLKTQSRCTSRMHQRSTNHQNRMSSSTQDQAKADRFLPPIDASPTLTAPQERRGSKREKTRCARGRGNQSFPPGPTTAAQQLSKPKKSEANSGGRRTKKGDCSLCFGCEENGERSCLLKMRKKGGGQSAASTAGAHHARAAHQIARAVARPKPTQPNAALWLGWRLNEKLPNSPQTYNRTHLN